MSSDPFTALGIRPLRYVALAALLLAMLSPAPALAQVPDDRATHLSVGVLVAPPFMMKTANGRWDGLSIELWQELAKALDLEFTWREYANLAEVREALARGEVEVVPGLAITLENELALDFSHPFYRSGSAIATSLTESGSDWRGMPKRLFLLDVLRMLGILLLLWFTAGGVLWLFERSREEDIDTDGRATTIELSMWWAVVTMTTVGYGDITPKTRGGRIVAVVWMLASIILIASFTATVTTELTVSALHGKIRGLSDLTDSRVGSVTDSQSVLFLARHGIEALTFENESRGLQAIVDGELDAFVYNQAMLAHSTATEFPAKVQLLPRLYDPYFVGVALRPGSALREPVDRALLRLMAGSDWPRWVERFVETKSD